MFYGLSKNRRELAAKTVDRAKTVTWTVGSALRAGAARPHERVESIQSIAAALSHTQKKNTRK